MHILCSIFFYGDWQLFKLLKWLYEVYNYNNNCLDYLSVMSKEYGYYWK